jgi:hypothetical protein
VRVRAPAHTTRDSRPTYPSPPLSSAVLPFVSRAHLFLTPAIASVAVALLSSFAGINLAAVAVGWYVS